MPEMATAVQVFVVSKQKTENWEITIAKLSFHLEDNN